MLLVQRRVDAACSTLMQRLQQWLPFNPQGFGACRRTLAFNTAASFTTNTNWQAYGGEIDDELSDADGRARVPQLRVGGGRHRARHRLHPRHRAAREGHARQLLGGHGPRARCGCCCPSASSARCSSCRRASCRTCGRTTWSRRSTAATADASRRVRSRRRKSSRSSAPTAAASSTPTARTRSRTRRRCRTSSRCSAIFAISAGLTYTLGDMTGSRAPRLGGLGRDGVPLPRRRDDGLLGRGARQPAAAPAGADQTRQRAVARRQHGGQGGRASASPTRRSSPP